MPRKQKAAPSHIVVVARDQNGTAGAAPLKRKAAGAGLPQHDAHDVAAGTAAPNASGDGQSSSAIQAKSAASLAPIIAEIRAWHQQRVAAMEQRKRTDLALGAFVRTQLGWSRKNDASVNATIRKQAAELIAIGEKVANGKIKPPTDANFSACGDYIVAVVLGRAPIDEREKFCTKEMERLASSLPVWSAWGEGIKGFGARSLAVIVGEAGDLSNYKGPNDTGVAKLWKRMGLAVMDGIRQGGLTKNASKQDWIAHGYNKKRRSYMFVIGDVLVKNKGIYRDIYLQRKKYERDRAIANGLTVAPAAKIPEKRKHEFMSDGHIHRRSQRYMEKRLLRDLWKAWRSAKRPLATIAIMPSASIPVKAGKRRARYGVTPNLGLPAAASSGQPEHPTGISMEPKDTLSDATTSAQAERPAKRTMPSTQALPGAKMD